MIGRPGLRHREREQRVDVCQLCYARSEPRPLALRCLECGGPLMACYYFTRHRGRGRCGATELVNQVDYWTPDAEDHPLAECELRGGGRADPGFRHTRPRARDVRRDRN